MPATTAPAGLIPAETSFNDGQKDILHLPGRYEFTIQLTSLADDAG